MRIAVCDDEPKTAELVSRMITDALPDCEVRRYHSGGAFLAEEGRFDIVFLDIQMKGLDGIQTARMLRQKDEDCLLIFITGAKEYVFDAFDVSAFHYLLKPVRPEKLREVLDRARKRIGKRTGEGRRLVIRKKGTSLAVGVEDILYLESQMHRVLAHTAAQTISFYGVMSELEREVGADFYRCHRGYLVNMAYITQYDAECICLTNGERIYVARERYRDFVKHYMRYLRNGGASHA